LIALTNLIENSSDFDVVRKSQNKNACQAEIK